ncbi:MAG: TM2 domain-containing protein [Novosphingobium sp.]
MAKYNGDISQFQDSFYRSRNDKNLFVAILLCFFLGFTGIHRFYLNQQGHGLFHLGLCFVAVMFGLFTFNFWLFAYVIMAQSLILFVEIIMLFVQVVNEGG